MIIRTFSVNTLKHNNMNSFSNKFSLYQYLYFDQVTPEPEDAVDLLQAADGK